MAACLQYQLNKLNKHRQCNRQGRQVTIPAWKIKIVAVALFHL